MQAKIDTLKFKNSNNEEYVMYPRTVIKAITNENGDKLEDTLNKYIDEHAEAVITAQGYAKTADVEAKDAETLESAKQYNDAAYANANAYTDTAIANLINGAPTTLDTLGEIATAMADNKDVVDALDEAIGKKANQAELDTHTGNDTIHVTADERTEWNQNATDVSNIINGTTPVGDASKLGGKGASEYMQGVSSHFLSGETILDWANNPNGNYKRFAVAPNYPSDAPTQAEGYYELKIDFGGARKKVIFYQYGTNDVYTRELWTDSWRNNWTHGLDGGNADTVNGVIVYNDFTEVDSTFSNQTPISEINDKMQLGSMLHATVWNGSSAVYPEVDGFLEIHRSKGGYSDFKYIGRHSGKIWTGGGQAEFFTGWVYSADGGNADTVDGRHASDFMVNVGDYGWVIPEHNMSQNLNDWVTKGTYCVGAACSNVPSDTDGWGNLLVFGGIGDRITQLFLPWNSSGHLYFRTLEQSEWGSWIKIATTADLANYIPSIKYDSQSYIPFDALDGGRLGFLGMHSLNTPVFIKTDGYTSYDLLHTGNKPGGEYVGTGEATRREIATGGVGKICIVYSSYGTRVITDIGCENPGSMMSEEAAFYQGNLIIVSTANNLNESGVLYYYQVL